jgi:Ca2+-transporting ATPase
VNLTAFEDMDPDSGQLLLIGRKTETALLKFAKELGWANYKQTKDAEEIVHMFTFSSERKAMAVVVKLRGPKWRLYVKGASEILTKKCTHHVLVRDHDEDEVATAAIDDLGKENISRTIIFYANQTLRTFALCYQDFDLWSPAGYHFVAPGEVSCSNCTFRKLIQIFNRLDMRI